MRQSEHKMYEGALLSTIKYYLLHTQLHVLYLLTAGSGVGLSIMASQVMQ